MKSTSPRNLFLWTGKKHSGKTTCLNALVNLAKSNGFKVSGILAPSRYEKNELLGFDIVDLSTGEKTTLSNADHTKQGLERFVFTKEAKLLGQNALDPSIIEDTDLIIIDEFGPLELMSDGWSKEVQDVISASEALVIIVVRQELIEKVSRFLNVPMENALASSDESIKQVIEILKRNRND